MEVEPVALPGRRVDGGIKKKVGITEMHAMLSDSTCGSWETRTGVVTDYLANNLLKIGIANDGTFEFIKSCIYRGNLHETSREKCWKHILIELNCIIGLENCTPQAAEEIVLTELLVPTSKEEESSVPVGEPQALCGALRPSSGQSSPGEEAKVIIEGQMKQACSPPPSPAAPMQNATKMFLAALPKAIPEEAGAKSGSSSERAADENVSLKGLSMMERQKVWLQRRNSKMEANRQQAEDAETAQLTFKPKINSNSSTSSTSTAAAGAANAGGTKGGRRSNWATAKNLVTAVNAAGGQGKARASRRNTKAGQKTSPRPLGAGGGKTKGGRRMSTQERKGHAALDKQLAALASMKADLLSSPTKEGSDQPTKEGDEKADTENDFNTANTAVSTTSAAVEKLEPVKSSKDVVGVLRGSCDRVVEGMETSMNTRIENAAACFDSPRATGAKAAAAAAAVTAACVATVEAKTPPNGFKFSDNSTAEKGRFVVRDIKDYKCDTIFRRRDTGGGSSQRGISLVMGYHNSNGRQDVISVLFDRSYFDEASAGEWWDTHRTRFLSASQIPIAMQAC
jgi:hypothetical protein